MGDGKDITRVPILVLGDWVVDENWIVTTERSPTSSHVGSAQFRSLIYNKNAQTLTLCAAGGVAGMLHALKPTKHSWNFSVYGMGYWDPEDTIYLAALFSTKSIPNQTSLSVRGIATDEAIKAQNRLCPRTERSCLEAEHTCEQLLTLGDDKSGTWRVTRVYELSGTERPALLHRYDWESLSEQALKKENIQAKVASMDQQNPKWEKFESVVVADHQKGAVTKDLVEALLVQEQTRDARWFIRTKNPRVDWIDTVRKAGKLELLVVGPLGLELSSDRWFIGEHLTPEGIGWLCHNTGCQITSTKEQKYWRRGELAHTVVTIHEDNHLAALVPESKQYGDLYVCTDHPCSPSIRVGRTTALFASLVAAAHGYFGEGKNKKTKLTKTDFERGLLQAYKHCETTKTSLAAIRSKRPDDEFNLRGNFIRALQVPRDYRDNPFKIRHHDLMTSLLDWSAAFDQRNRGVLGGDETRFEVWRGWSAVNDVVAVSNEQRKGIARLMQAVRKFRDHPDPQNSLSVCILGGPGEGKSYLVQRMAKDLGMGFLEFNITQFVSIEDLMSCFDTISSFQTRDPSRRLVVFVDEINAPLGGQDVYGQFLGPLSRGVYRRGGQTFQLRPCAWVFAGTDQPQPPKGSDFKSRLTVPTLNLRGGDSLDHLYLAISLVRRYFPDVSRVSDNMLGFFLGIEPKYGIRSIEFIVSRLRDITHGELTLKNLPEPEEFTTWLDDVRENGSREAVLENILGYEMPSSEDDEAKVRILWDPGDFVFNGTNGDIFRELTEKGIAEIETYLAMSIDDLYEEVGKRISRMKDVDYSREKAISEAKHWLQNNKDKIYKKICMDWRYCEKKDDKRLLDKITLLAAVADLIAIILEVPPVVTTGVLVSVLLFRIGMLDELCKCEETTGTT